MTSTRPISRTAADKALKAIREQFKSWIGAQGEMYGPQLVEAWDGKNWAICWDGGPYAWTTLAVQGGNDVEYGTSFPAAQNFPSGDVFAEPYDNCVLVLYREQD